MGSHQALETASEIHEKYVMDCCHNRGLVTRCIYRVQSDELSEVFGNFFTYKFLHFLGDFKASFVSRKAFQGDSYKTFAAKGLIKAGI